jgi:polyketide cyclase/dehydrase/lipid transport protein
MKKHTFHAERFIAASPEAVFEIFSDHLNMDRFEEISKPALLKEGADCPRGKGAVRELSLTLFHLLPVRFTEVMDESTAPGLIRYTATDAKLRLGLVSLWAGVKHHGAEIRIEPGEGGSTVFWSATISVPLPLIGNPMGTVIRIEGERIFDSVLDQLKSSLEE